MFLGIAILGFTLAGGAYTLLLMQLSASWRGRRPGGILLGAAGLTACWAFLAAYEATNGALESGPLTLLDALRISAWILFLSVLLGFRGYRYASWINGAVWVAAGAAAVAFLAAVAHTLTGQPTVIPWMGSLAYPSLLTLGVVGLVLVEQLYRHCHQDRRWALKFLCIGLGGLFAYDVFVYSQALMYQQVPGGAAAARGIIQTLVVPLLAIAVSRNPDWSLNIFVSRRAVLHSAALLASGAYLILMAAGGYYIRLYGGSWGGVVQLSFLFGALLLLLVVLFSGRLRSSIKIWISRHFFQSKYDYRDEWQRLTATLSDTRSPLVERVIRALAQIVESPGGALWLRHDGGGLVPAGHWNMRVGHQVFDSLQTPWARRMSEDFEVIELGDRVRAPGPPSDVARGLPQWLLQLADAWLLVPLLQGQQLQGLVLLSRPRAAHRLTWEDRELLEAASAQVCAHIVQQQAQLALLERSQFEAFSRFSTFVVHDLKNLVAQLSLLISNASRHRHNPEFVDDAIETLEHSVTRMKHLLEQLRGGVAQRDGRTETVPLCPLLEQAVARQGQRRPVAVITHCDSRLAVQAQPEQLTQVVAHIVDNAQDATVDTGTVEVRALSQGNRAVIEVSDSGRGMSADFIANDLFRPFVSTKGRKGMGIGAYQARTLLRELGGDIEVSSRPGEGSRFRLLLPEASTEASTESATAGQPASAADTVAPDPSKEACGG